MIFYIYTNVSNFEIYIENGSFLPNKILKTNNFYDSIASKEPDYLLVTHQKLSLEILNKYCKVGSIEPIVVSIELDFSESREFLIISNDGETRHDLFSNYNLENDFGIYLDFYLSSLNIKEIIAINRNYYPGIFDGFHLPSSLVNNSLTWSGDKSISTPIDLKVRIKENSNLINLSLIDKIKTSILLAINNSVKIKKTNNIYLASNIDYLGYKLLTKSYNKEIEDKLIIISNQPNPFESIIISGIETLLYYLLTDNSLVLNSIIRNDSDSETIMLATLMSVFSESKESTANELITKISSKYTNLVQETGVNKLESKLFEKLNNSLETMVNDIDGFYDPNNQLFRITYALIMNFESNLNQLEEYINYHKIPEADIAIIKFIFGLVIGYKNLSTDYKKQIDLVKEVEEVVSKIYNKSIYFKATNKNNIIETNLTLNNIEHYYCTIAIFDIKKLMKDIKSNLKIPELTKENLGKEFSKITRVNRKRVSNQLVQLSTFNKILNFYKKYIELEKWNMDNNSQQSDFISFIKTNPTRVNVLYEQIITYGKSGFKDEVEFDKTCELAISIYLKYHDYSRSNNIMQFYKTSVVPERRSTWFTFYSLIIYGKRNPTYYLKNPNVFWNRVNNLVESGFDLEKIDLAIFDFLYDTLKIANNNEENYLDYLLDFTSHYTENKINYSNQANVFISRIYTEIHSSRKNKRPFRQDIVAFKKVQEVVLSSSKLLIEPDQEIGLNDSNKKVIIIGEIATSPKLFGIAEQYGITKDQIILIKKLTEINNFSFDNIKYNPDYIGIIADAFKATEEELEFYRLTLHKLKNEIGFPLVIEYVNNIKTSSDSEIIRKSLQDFIMLELRIINNQL